MLSLHLGAGPTLLEACPWLQDDHIRHERILDVAEPNSVIEGLPPFTDQFRDRLRAELWDIAERRRAAPLTRDRPNRPRT